MPTRRDPLTDYQHWQARIWQEMADRAERAKTLQLEAEVRAVEADRRRACLDADEGRPELFGRGSTVRGIAISRRRSMHLGPTPETFDPTMPLSVRRMSVERGRRAARSGSPRPFRFPRSNQSI
jgi:hypothetical protein